MIRIGPVQLDVAGDSPVARKVRSELADPGLRVDTSEPPQLVLDIRSGGTRCSKRSNLQLSETRTPFRYRSRRSAEERIEMSLMLKWSQFSFYDVGLSGDLLRSPLVNASIRLPDVRSISALTRPLSKVVSRDGMSVADVTAKNVIYELVDPLVWLRLLMLDATMVHSSAVVTPDRCVMFMGSGGVGKSTALLTLLDLVPESTYLSDDLLAFGRDGVCYRHPKRLQIYEYNLRAAPGLRSRVWSLLTPSQVAIWRIRSAFLGGHQARSRVGARDLFGSDRVAGSAAATHAVWITPGNGDLKWTTITRDELAERCSAAILAEFWDFLRLLNSASLLSSAAPSINEVAGRTIDIVREGLVDVECLELEIPVGKTNGLATHLSDRLLR